MGKVKFEFPNQLGIYLHDTPETQLMAKEARMYSSGCIRLQDAQRLGRWLFDGAMPMAGEAESRIDLPSLVPVYVTYLTLQPQDDGGVVVLGDPYGRDVTGEPALAASIGAFRPSR
jgi:murein L,D-transpeptidase YcbB/YkuD